MLNLFNLHKKEEKRIARIKLVGMRTNHITHNGTHFNSVLRGEKKVLRSVGNLYGEESMELVCMSF